MSYFIPQYLLPTDPVAGQGVEENDEATAGRRRRRKRSKHSSKKHKSKARKKRKKAKAKKRTPSTLYQHPPPAPVVAPVHRFGASEFRVNPMKVRGDRAGEYYLAADGYYGGKNNPIDVDAKKVKEEKKSSDNNKGGGGASSSGGGGSRASRTQVQTRRRNNIAMREHEQSIALMPARQDSEKISALDKRLAKLEPLSERQQRKYGLRQFGDASQRAFALRTRLDPDMEFMEQEMPKIKAEKFDDLYD